MNAIVAQTLEEAGVHLSPGESIQYIIVDAKGKKNPAKAIPLALYAYEDGYDAKKYTDLVLQAVETLMEPLGYTEERLRKCISC